MRKRVLGILLALLAAGAGLFWGLDIPHWQRLDLDRLDAAAATVVLDAGGHAVGAPDGAQPRVYVEIGDIPPTVRNAFIAAEDRGFYRHHGISLRRIAAAAARDLRDRSLSQGASTITQQLVKLTHLSSTKSFSRKAQEAFLAIQLETKLSKDEILEKYLNTVYFGGGAYGIGSAARFYFDKKTDELSLSEAALLAGVIKSPTRYAPHLHPENALSRRDLVLEDMRECGFITEAQETKARDEPLTLRATRAETNGWFTDAALDESAEALSLGMDALLSGGYVIETAFEPKLQAAAEALFADAGNFPAGGSDGVPVQAALVAMRPDSGAICAVIGGRSYDARRGLNRAVGIRRSPGSAIKPVSTVAAAVDRFGYVPTSVVDDTPRVFEGNYAPGNAGGGSYGIVTLREALSRSLNIAAVDLADTVGVDSVREYAARFGLPLSDSDANLALALGSMTDGVSPARLCAAYAALANGGTRVNGHFVERIRDAQGRVLYEAPSDGRRAVSGDSACLITDMLRTAASTGSARALAGVGFDVAGKTGTVEDSDGSSRDLWTAAYTPDLALTVWMGYDLPDGAHRIPAAEGGSGYPARLCASFLRAASDALSREAFEISAGVRRVLLDAVALEKHEVRLAAARTPADLVVAELFRADDLPNVYSENWNIPQAVDDLTLTRDGDTALLQFTARDDAAEYLVRRATAEGTEIIAALRGSAGERLTFPDEYAEGASYTVQPRNRLLFERGISLIGSESNVVRAPQGIWTGLF